MDDFSVNPVFKIPVPKEVWYCDRPLRAPGAIPRKISISELEKIVGNGFQYSEDIHTQAFSQLPFPVTSRLPEVKQAILERLKNPLTDKLVICKIDNEVGHGVFARKPIKFNDIVAIYTGQFCKSSDRTDPVYSLDVELLKKRSGYRVDANKIGGIARFFQHLPLNLDVLALHRTAKFKTGRKCIKRSLDLGNTLSELTPEEADASIEMLLYDASEGGGVKISEMMNYNRDPAGAFEVEHTELSVSWHEIAIANLGMSSLVLKDGVVPLIYFYAEKDIGVGEQVGFSYVLGYWAHRAMLPRFFDLNGSVLSRDLYKYTKMPFSIEREPGDPRVFSYSRQQYNEDKLKHQPVELRGELIPIPIAQMSFFKTRKILAENNIIDSTGLPRQPSQFVLQLRKLLPEDVLVEIYERDPEAKNPDERYIFDVVCTATSLQRWAQLTVFIRQDPIIGEYCISLQRTKEIIIKGVNIHPKAMFEFIKSKMATAEKFFANKIPDELLPHEEEDLFKAMFSARK